MNNTAEKFTIGKRIACKEIGNWEPKVRGHYCTADWISDVT